MRTFCTKHCSQLESIFYSCKNMVSSMGEKMEFRKNKKTTNKHFDNDIVMIVLPSVTMKGRSKPFSFQFETYTCTVFKLEFVFLQPLWLIIQETDQPLRASISHDIVICTCNMKISRELFIERELAFFNIGLHVYVT